MRLLRDVLFHGWWCLTSPAPEPVAGPFPLRLCLHWLPSSTQRPAWQGLSHREGACLAHPRRPSLGQRSVRFRDPRNVHFHEMNVLYAALFDVEKDHLNSASARSLTASIRMFWCSTPGSVATWPLSAIVAESRTVHGCHDGLAPSAPVLDYRRPSAAGRSPAWKRRERSSVPAAPARARHWSIAYRGVRRGRSLRGNLSAHSRHSRERELPVPHRRRPVSSGSGSSGSRTGQGS